MKRRGWSKVVAVFAFVFALGAFTVVTPAYGAESAATVDIEAMTDTAAIKTAVESTLETSNSVTIVNSGEGPYNANTNDLKLFIPENKTVVWTADYTGQTTAENALLFLAGGGTIEIRDSAIINTGEGSVVYQGNGNVIVAGESTISGNGLALAGNGNIDIQGGNITSNKGAVLCIGQLTMSGGVVHATEGYAISAEGVSSSVNISGGLVFALFAETETAESAHGVAGDKLTSAINMLYGEPTIRDTAVVVVWDTLAGNTSYIAGTADDLTITPANAAAWWTQDGISGLRYNGTEFFAFDKITATDPMDIPTMNDGTETDSGMNTTVLVIVLVGFFAVAAISLLVWRARRKAEAHKRT